MVNNYPLIYLVLSDGKGENDKACVNCKSQITAYTGPFISLCALQQNRAKGEYAAGKVGS